MIRSSFLNAKSLVPKLMVAGMSSAAKPHKHTLPDLTYDFNALEPYIAADIMKLHYEKHHATYVNNLNVAEEKLADAVAKGDISTIIQLEPVLRFNGGGHINHSIFWKNLSPQGGGEPTGDLMEAIRSTYTSFSQMKDQLTAACVGVQGSGWGWLGYNKATQKLQIATCFNQDPLQSTTGLIPLLGIDVWEHAYYLQYKNVRGDYVKAIWNVLDWEAISNRFKKARLG